MRDSFFKKDLKLSLKRIFGFHAGETFRMICAFLLIFFSVFFNSPRRGLISSFPIIFVVCAVVNFIYYSPKRMMICGMASALIVSMADFADPRYTVIYTAAMGVYVLLSVLAWDYALGTFTGYNNGTPLIRVISFAGVAVLLAVYFVCMGTPWQSMAVSDRVKGYMEEKYPGQTFTSYRPGYYIAEGKYTVDVYYDYKGSEISSPMVITDEGIEDGYFENTTNLLMLYRRTELLAFIKKNYFDDEIDITPRAFNGSPEDFETFDELPEDIPSYYNDRMEFNFLIYDHSVDLADFAEKSAKYARLLEEEGKIFHRIVFYGGEQGMSLYQLTYEYGDDISLFPEKAEFYTSYKEFKVER